jgi:hypothetical protein
MLQRPHKHTCEHCQQDVPCSGTYERNWDGWPEVICTAFDSLLPGEPSVCQDCYETRCQSGQSERCSEYGAKHAWIAHAGTPAQEAPITVCSACLAWERDNEQAEHEAAAERSLEQFYGGSSAQSDAERYQVAAEQKRRLR